MAPLSYAVLDYASAFCSEQCAEGVVAISGDTLRILAVESLGQLFNQTTLPLRYTPRKMAVSETNHLIIVEAGKRTTI